MSQQIYLLSLQLLWFLVLLWYIDVNFMMFTLFYDTVGVASVGNAMILFINCFDIGGADR